MFAQTFLTVVLATSSLATAAGTAPESLRDADAGLPAGALAPDFDKPDQADRKQTLASLMGPKGLVLVFFRSADW